MLATLTFILHKAALLKSGEARLMPKLWEWQPLPQLSLARLLLSYWWITHVSSNIFFF